MSLFLDVQLLSSMPRKTILDAQSEYRGYHIVAG